MNNRALHSISPLVLAQVRRAALEKGILRGNAAAVVARLEEMAADLLPDRGNIFSAVFSTRDASGPVLSPREIGDLFWREREAGIEARRREGSFYTPEPLVDSILDLACPVAKIGLDGNNPTVCDPAVGCGFFPLRLAERALSRRKRPGVVREWAGQCLFGVDIDAAAVFMTRVLLWLALSDAGGEFVPSPERFRVGDSLLGPSFGADGGNGDGLDWAAAFPDVAACGGFDAVVGNPPYEVLTNFGRHPERARLAAALRAVGEYQDALRGQINLYRCFIERGLSLVRPGGVLSFIVPLSLARDGTAEAMRGRLLQREKADEWLLFGEKERLFAGVTQSACVFRARRAAGRAERIGVSVCGSRGRVGLKELERFGPGLIIPGLGSEGMELRRWFYKNCPGRLGDLAEVRVGDVDQTVYRECMTDYDTGCILARGGHLEAFCLDVKARSGKERFLDLTRFLAMKGKGAALCRERAARWRVVQLGIRNLHSTPRLLAASVGPGVYLGNSLNVYYPCEGVSLKYLAGILNSVWLDWLFRVGSGNNNINIREMMELPVPVRVGDGERLAVEEAFQVCELEAAAGGVRSRALLDAAVARCYGVPDMWSAENLPPVL